MLLKCLSIIILLFFTLPAFGDEYERGYKDGFADGANPICPLVVEDICDANGIIPSLFLQDAVANPCYDDAIIHCDKLKKIADDRKEKLVTRLKKRIRRLKRLQ